ncbi:mitochondrial ribosomal protein MRP51 [Xylariaceae sp. FL0662B]|nr:mitochondrial ribosomal protein MRP51 [Xylariaceae sp. FL0662B]
MAGRSVSPGAALLRSSRMFSMPAPIPTPPGDYSSATKHHSSTATVHYPTRLSVTTPSSSRATGDWGFKRPLPLKTTTNTTTPLLRVMQVDSTEHVTDFHSSSDHTMTLLKYQELNLPVSVPIGASYDAFNQARNPKSVFEEDGDVTALTPEQRAELENKRWKFTGPWLAGMTDGDFERYLVKTVRGRRPEFRAYLKEKLAAQTTKDRAQKAREDNVAEPPAVSASDITESQFTNYLRELRQDRFELYNLVSRFLDLAPVDQDITFSQLGTLKPNQGRELTRGSPYAGSGPPITHPSAGISYLRTRNFLDNHPIYGPQLHHPPIRARILKPRSATTAKPMIGVGGFVVKTPGGDSSFNAVRLKHASKNSGLNQVDFETYGGPKMYVQPTSSYVDSTGKIVIGIDDANPVSVTIQKEAMGEEGGRVFEDEIKLSKTPQVKLNPTRSYRSRPGFRSIGSARSYGLGRDQ